jgi:CMP-N-acetylneuraminic acid synthetase
MKIVAFVPIKLNSTRIKNKNIKRLGDKPLCHYIFNVIKKSGVDDIFVYCSEKKIKQYVPKFVQFLARDESLDGDTTKGMEIYTAFCSEIKADIYILAHATSPFLRPNSIKIGLKSISEGYDSAFGVKKIQTFSWYEKRPLNYSLNDIPRTQDLQPVFVETSGFYIFTSEVIKQKRRIGNNPYLVELDHIESVDIDEKEDLSFARKIFRSKAL